MNDPNLIVSVKALHLTLLRQIAGSSSIRESNLIEKIKASEVKRIDTQLSQSPDDIESLRVSYEHSPLKRAHDVFRDVVKSQISVLLGSGYIEEVPTKKDERYSVSARTKSRFFRMTEKGRSCLSSLEGQLANLGTHTAAIQNQGSALGPAIA